MQDLVLWLVRVNLVLVLTMFSVGVNAHNTNKVVVIPLAGDPPPLKAVTPIPPADTSQSNYIINDNPGDEDTVLDTVTGLEWQRMDDNVIRNWDEAFAYCDDLNNDAAFAGKTHWRLPSVTELQSIVDYGNSLPAIEGVAFTGTNSSSYWSASSVASNSADAWLVNFSSGGFSNNNVTVNYHVRCVR